MNIEETLRRHNLRRTEIREQVLGIFQDAQYALSHGMIEERLPDDANRITLYRTLKTFEESGLVHRVANDEDSVMYALCSHHEHCHDHGHNDEHVHFKCEACGNTFCLEGVSVPKITLPQGFRAAQFQFLASGVCEKCNV